MFGARPGDKFSSDLREILNKFVDEIFDIVRIIFAELNLENLHRVI